MECPTYWESQNLLHDVTLNLLLLRLHVYATAKYKRKISNTKEAILLQGEQEVPLMMSQLFYRTL